MGSLLTYHVTDAMFSGGKSKFDLRVSSKYINRHSYFEVIDVVYVIVDIYTNRKFRKCWIISDQVGDFLIFHNLTYIYSVITHSYFYLKKNEIKSINSHPLSAFLHLIGGNRTVSRKNRRTMTNKR